MTTRSPAACGSGIPVLLTFSVVLCGCVATAVDEPVVPAVNRVEPSRETRSPSYPVLNLEELSAVRLGARPLSVMRRNPFEFAGHWSDSDHAASLPVEDPWWDEPSPWESSPWPPALDSFDAGPELVFLGVVDAPASAGRVAVVKAGATIHHGRVGDVLAEYRVVAIETPRLDLEPAAGGSVQTLWMASGRP